MEDENLFKSYTQALDKLVDSINKLAETHASWMRFVLAGSSALFGILISLHERKGDYSSTCWCFPLSIFLLGIGILTGVISLYSVVDNQVRAKKQLTHELESAPRERRKIAPIGVETRPIFVFCERVCYVSLSLSVIFLAVYSLSLI